MADAETTIRRCGENYRMGAYCESLFYAYLIEIEDNCPPERLWAALPNDARDGLRNAVLCEEAWARLEGLSETIGFRRLHEWLASR